MYDSRKVLQKLNRLQEMSYKTCPNCGSVGKFHISEEDEDGYICKHCSYEGSIQEDIDNYWYVHDECGLFDDDN